ncbi:MAG: hypothetical protein V3S25_03800, partial [Nitrospirales bacterium]
MTKPLPPLKRDYQRHGLNVLKGALKNCSGQEGWLEDLGDVGEALKAWRMALVEDLGGEDHISAMERSIVELATKTQLLLSSIDKFLLEQPSLVNKRRRQLFPVVLQRQQLADALARYISQLGLKRRPKPALTIRDYMAARQDGGESNH